MLTDFAQRLRDTIERELPCLRSLDESRASTRTSPDRWCPKEELGHLIDSAANNHQRFVRAVIEGEFRGQGYAQDEWVKLQGYTELEWQKLVDLWFAYNNLLAHLIARIPEERASARVVIGWDGPATLSFVIKDYIRHMQHHLDAILQKEKITPFPALTEEEKTG